MSDDVAPYPEAPEGTKFRAIPFPCESPDRTPREPVKVARKSGGECDVITVLGVAPSTAPRSPDELVRDWYEWPP